MFGLRLQLEEVDHVHEPDAKIGELLSQQSRRMHRSDGLYGGAPLGAIRRVLGSREAPARIARRLIELALRGEAADNVSAIVLAVDDGRASAAKRRRSSRNQVRRRSKPAMTRSS